MILSNTKAQEQKTAQDHEIQFGTNVLGHHLLIKLLKPTLVETASHSEPDTVRIILTSSSAHFFFPPKKMIKNWDLSDEAAKQYKPDALYGRSKLGNIHQAYILSKELDSKGIIVASCHVSGGGRSTLTLIEYIMLTILAYLSPEISALNYVSGTIMKSLSVLQKLTHKPISFLISVRHAPSWQARFGSAVLLWPVYYGAISQLYAGTAKADHDFLQNAYFVPWAKKVKPYAIANDAALAEKTWQWCEDNSKGF
jgi:retinol dehydrogenase-12